MAGEGQVSAMKMRARRRRAFGKATDAMFPRNEQIRPFRFIDGFRRDPRWERRMLRLAEAASDAIAFPPPADTWGTVTHTIGPFVPLPTRRDVRFERRLARMRGRIKAALVITEE